jgi:hypothetical protein
MNPILKKLQFKGQDPVLVLDAPDEFAKVAKDFGVIVHSAPKKQYAFILAFARSLTELDSVAATVEKALEEDGIFWSAYPKGTSKKYKKTDINRDTGHERMSTHGFDGVSLVAIDDDWSAMRFRRKS